MGGVGGTKVISSGTNTGTRKKACPSTSINAPPSSITAELTQDICVQLETATFMVSQSGHIILSATAVAAGCDLAIPAFMLPLIHTVAMASAAATSKQTNRRAELFIID